MADKTAINRCLQQKNGGGVKAQGGLQGEGQNHYRAELTR